MLAVLSMQLPFAARRLLKKPPAGIADRELRSRSNIARSLR
jgi:hypothetical protein